MDKKAWTRGTGKLATGLKTGVFFSSGVTLSPGYTASAGQKQGSNLQRLCSKPLLAEQLNEIHRIAFSGKTPGTAHAVTTW
jgi:hypothetical protein